MVRSAIIRLFIALAVCCALPASAVAANLVANPGFESGNAVGWGGYNAGVTAEKYAGSRSGSYVARVTKNAFQTAFSIDDTGYPVASTVAGTQYVATAYVMAVPGTPTGQPMAVWIRETTPTGSVVKSTRSQIVNLGTTWKMVSVTATVAASGNRLDMYVYEDQAGVFDANAFYADDISLDLAGSAPTATPPTAPSALRVTASSTSSIALAWNASSGSTAIASYRVTRNGIVVGTVGGTTLAFTDSGLNAGAQYSYSVQAIDTVGLNSPASAILSASTLQPAPTSDPTLPKYYSPTSFWNVKLPKDAPIDAQSATMVNNSIVPWGAPQSPAIVNYKDWGLPLYQAKETDPLFTISGSYYNSGPVSCRIPLNAQSATGGDNHLIVLQPDGTECDYWGFSWTPYYLTNGGLPPSAYTANKVCGVVAGANRDAWGTSRCKGQMGGGAVAAGYAALGGAVTPDEIRNGVIPHALAIGLPSPVNAVGMVWPAVNYDGKSTAVGAIPDGARIRLDPTYNIDANTSLTAWQKVILRAMQDYGAFVSDQGQQMGIRATISSSDADWTNVGVPIGGSLKALPWDRMQIVQMTPAGQQPSWSTAS